MTVIHDILVVRFLSREWSVLPTLRESTTNIIAWLDNSNIPYIEVKGRVYFVLPSKYEEYTMIDEGIGSFMYSHETVFKDSIETICNNFCGNLMRPLSEHERAILFSVFNCEFFV